MDTGKSWELLLSHTRERGRGRGGGIWTSTVVLGVLIRQIFRLQNQQDLMAD